MFLKKIILDDSDLKIESGNSAVSLRNLTNALNKNLDSNNLIEVLNFLHQHDNKDKEIFLYILY